MSYDKVLMYGGISLFGLFVINMILLLTSLDSLNVLNNEEGYWFSFLFVLGQMILVLQSQSFIKQSAIKEASQSTADGSRK